MIRVLRLLGEERAGAPVAGAGRPVAGRRACLDHLCAELTQTVQVSFLAACAGCPAPVEDLRK
eukprot:5549230-Prymnesium_polylepis.1